MFKVTTGTVFRFFYLRSFFLNLNTQIFGTFTSLPNQNLPMHNSTTLELSRSTALREHGTFTKKTLPKKTLPEWNSAIIHLYQMEQKLKTLPRYNCLEIQLSENMAHLHLYQIKIYQCTNLPEYNSPGTILP